MELADYLKKSLQKAIDRAGNMRKLAEDRGMDYSTINRFNSGENAIENMPIKTLSKLFPEITIYCFPEDIPTMLQSPPSVGDAEIIDELSDMVKQLQPREKLKLLTLVAANFGEKIREEAKK